MDTHIGQFIIMVIQIVSAVWSEIRKNRSEARLKGAIGKGAEEVKEEARVKAEQVAMVAKMVSEEMDRRMTDLETKLQHNTRLTEHAVEVNTKALDAANNFNAKWQVLAEADAERLLSGRLQEITVIGAQEVQKGNTLLHDIRRVEADTNTRIQDVQVKVDLIAEVAQAQQILGEQNL